MICNQDIPEKKCPKVNCRRDDCCGCPFRKVVIPAVAGDDETGEVIPENGLFANALVEYEANGAMYIYASDGIFTRIGSNAKSEETASITYVDSKFLNAKRYTDTEIDEASNSMTLYVDGADAVTLADAKSYTDTEVSDAVDDAKAYADDKTATALQAAKDYADTKDAAVLQAAKDYTDSAASSVVTRTYVDNGDSTTLQTAKNYTDQEVGELQSSLATVATSGSYNDLTNQPDIPVITVTSTDPGEGADLPAGHFIFVYDPGA